MEIIIELLVELLFEGTFEISKNKKVPKFIRYPLILLIILLFIGVISLIFFTGILIYKETSKICGILLMLIGVALLVSSIIKFKKIYSDLTNK